MYYQDIMNLFDLQIVKLNNLPCVVSENTICTCDKKNIVRADDIFYLWDEHNQKSIIKFHPFNTLRESCSYLIMEDSIHVYLKKLTFNIFKKTIAVKDDTYSHCIPSWLDDVQLNKLTNPKNFTKYKLDNLFNIVSSTPFSKNLISCEIDFDRTLKDAKVYFKYPLYDMLCTIQDNTIFGLQLEDDEIRLFKQIYENYIITEIDSLFKESIKVTAQSDHYPNLYVLMTMKLMLEEFYWKKYNICFINCKKMIPKYKEMLSNLNRYNQYDGFTDFNSVYTEENRKLDQKAYQNELKKRKESEPDWTLLRGDGMGKSKQQLAVVKNNDIAHLIDEFSQFITYDLKQYQNKINRFNAEILAQNYKDNYQLLKNNQAWNEIFYLQNTVLQILQNDEALWYDIRIKQYCFRSKTDTEIIKVNSDELSKLLTKGLKEKITEALNQNNNNFLSNYAIEIVLVSKVKGIDKHILSSKERASNAIRILLFENEIKAIDNDVFEPTKNQEFFKNHNDSFYTRNRFIPNDCLSKRLERPSLNYNYMSLLQKIFVKEDDIYLLQKRDTQMDHKPISSFISNFIFYLVKEDIHIYFYVMNWLATFFQSLQKNGTALVLLGDQEVSQNILWEKIIKPIFGYQYSLPINDKECTSTLTADIAKDKLFFHIGDIDNADTKFDDTTLYRIVKDLLVDTSVHNENMEEIDIYGQLLITAKNPFPYIKRSLSKCTILEVNDMDTIIEKLNVPDEIMLEDQIKKDLDCFVGILNSFQGVAEFATIALNTQEREIVKINKSSNINKEEIDKHIDAFIQAIKNKDLDYFEKVKDINTEVYEHLKNAFEKDEGYFIGQDLLVYYNAIYQQKFSNKKSLMNKLKKKDDMFNQEVKTLKIRTKDNDEKVLFQSYKTTKETGNKELYKINNYKLAQDIIIPSGVLIVSSQSNISKFNFEDDKTLEVNRQYKQKKKN